MLRHLLLSLLTLAVPGLIAGACARPSPPPASSTAASPTSAAPATSTATSAPGRYCPWCSVALSVDNNKNNCKLFVQTPEDFSKVIDYPVLLFNNDLTTLVKADFLAAYVPNIDWWVNPSRGIGSTGLRLVIMPVAPDGAVGVLCGFRKFKFRNISYQELVVNVIASYSNTIFAILGLRLPSLYRGWTTTESGLPSTKQGS